MENPESPRQNNLRKLENELIEKGWKSMGELPAEISDKLQKGTPQTLHTRMAAFVREALEGEDEAYKTENVTKMGTKIYISPDLVSKVEEKIKAFYENTRVRFGSKRGLDRKE